MARVHLGHLAARRQHPVEAQTHFEAALALARAIGHLRHEGTALAGLADLLLQRGRADEAAALNEDLLLLRRRDGNAYNLALTLRRVAHQAASRGDTAHAAALLAGAQPLVRNAGSLVLLCVWCHEVGSFAADLRHWDGAVRLLAWASQFRAQHGYPADDEQARLESAQLNQAREALGDAAYEAARAAGAAFTAGEVLDLAARELSDRAR